MNRDSANKTFVPLAEKLEKRRFNTLFWSPQGQFIVLACLKSAEGPIEFIDTSDFTVMNTLMPELTTDIEWDPTGRYVVAGVSAWTGKVVSILQLEFHC